jgi:hypothetical protein
VGLVARFSSGGSRPVTRSGPVPERASLSLHALRLAGLGACGAGGSGRRRTSIIGQQRGRSSGRPLLRTADSVVREPYFLRRA